MTLKLLLGTLGVAALCTAVWGLTADRAALHSAAMAAMEQTPTLPRLSDVDPDNPPPTPQAVAANNPPLTSQAVGSFVPKGTLNSALAYHVADDKLWVAEGGQRRILRQYSKDGELLEDLVIDGLTTGQTIGAEFSVGEPPTGGCIDQEQRKAAVFLGLFRRTNTNQSFMAAADTMSGAELKTSPGVGTGGEVTIKLYDRIPCDENAVLLAEGTDTDVKPGEWATVEWDCVDIEPSVELWLGFTSTDGALGLAGDSENPYPHGFLTADPRCDRFANFDYAFATFCCPGVDCELVKSFKVKCKKKRLKVKIRSKLPEGNKLTVVVDGEEHTVVTNKKGNAKMKLRRQEGEKTVSLKECPEFEKKVDCGK